MAYYTTITLFKQWKHFRSFQGRWKNTRSHAHIEYEAKYINSVKSNTLKKAIIYTIRSTGTLVIKGHYFFVHLTRCERNKHEAIALRLIFYQIWIDFAITVIMWGTRF